ncbi:MAG: prepilin-type N-terminal cleavage/methylation domain-containing protein [Betaproteobacteria bacterium]|nr:MAG: prepilin-type N-terminal cleavage/methylation domain-containing protein [Betaproteobacteria bacterium]
MSSTVFNAAYNARARNRFAQLGVTLIELMIAMVIGLMIVAAIGYIYLQGRTGYKAQDAQSRMQEEMRLAVDVMTRDLQLAGRFGCTRALDRSSTEPDASTTVRLAGVHPYMTANSGTWLEKDGDSTNSNTSVDVSQLLRGYENGAGWRASAAMASARLAGTDTITLVRGGDDETHVSNFLPEGEKAIIQTIEPTTRTLFGAGTGGNDARLLVVSNCKSAYVVKADIKNNGDITFDNTLNPTPVDAAIQSAAPAGIPSSLRTPLDVVTVTTFSPVSYHIGTSATSTLPTLFRTEVMESGPPLGQIGLWGTPQPLVSGVENMRVRFSVNATDTATGRVFLTPSEINAAQVAGQPNVWLSVAAAEITLTVISEDANVRTKSEAQTAQGVTTTDARLRRVIRFVVETRNTGRDAAKSVRNQGDL